MKTLQYWGTGNFQEHPYTGRIVTWTEKEKQTVDDAIATKLLAANAGFVLDNDESGEVVTSQINSVTGVISCSAGGTNLNTVFADQVTDGYFCHLWAGSSGNGDADIPDVSGAGRHGTFHTNMTKAFCWANAGFASTDTGGAYRTFLLPVLNFDYAAGESLIVVWKGRGTAPGSFKGLIGDSNGSSEAGIAIRVNASGQIQPYLSPGGTGVFLTITGSAAVEPSTTHTYALMIDGVTRRFEQHIDGVVDGGVAMGGSLIGTGQSIDCRSAKAIKLGTQDDFSTAANTVSLQTQALVVLRGRKGLGVPANYRDLMRNIARYPNRLVTKAWW